MNVELLRKVAAVIQEKPRRFNMEAFVYRNKCGTSHCIGGWACALSGAESFGHDTAMRLLGLNYEQAGRLFYPDGEVHLQFGGWDATPKQAAARIEHFIATDGAE